MIGSGTNLLSPVFKTKADIFAFVFALAILSAYLFLPIFLVCLIYKDWNSDIGLSYKFLEKFNVLFGTLRVHS